DQIVDYVWDSNAGSLSLTKKTYSGSCASPPAGGTVLLGDGGYLNDNVQVRKFDNVLINDSLGNSSSVQVSLQLTTGAVDLISGTVCNPAVKGSQFCSATALTNTITLRGGQ
ncbi:MAG TPA: hypothetical protein VJJ83_03185, partial [Candidatus Babeliales bacterium]|nr:hypothetical protein [Candidatus Babeliales bacterium]